MKLCVAKNAGFCFGVDRAVRMTEENLRQSECYCIGELIHNRNVVHYLESLGLHTVTEAEQVPEGAKVIIRSHGISERELSELTGKNCEIVDATCPKVAKIHRIVHNASEKGNKIIILGDENHPEVRGIFGWCKGATIISDEEELKKMLLSGFFCDNADYTVVEQTTSNRLKIEQSLKILKNRCTNIEIFDTICNATQIRQDEAFKLASGCDAVIVVGGLHSANSCHLAEICRVKCGKVVHVEEASQLNTSDFKGKHLIGVTAGASTPMWNIKEVVNKMNEELEILEEESVPVEEPVAEVAVEAAEEIAVEVADDAAAKEAPACENAPVEEGEKTFDQLLEDSIKTISNGDTVTGIVVGINATDVVLDLGTKHSCYIDIAEFTNDDASVNINDIVHVGDSIQATVVRVNDVEGTVKLSKRRLDAARGWDDIEKAREEGTVLEGKVSEENKGGVVISVRGIRVFVPASQTGLGRDEPMSALLGKTVRFRVTEVNRSRKRVVGSIKSVLYRERKEMAEKIWSEIEVGKKYNGTVKSLTSYGAFVDIGGVDGMVHVTELSWKRIGKPADVLNIGDEIEVYVISFDPEKKKISLGYRKAEDNPWVKFVSAYKEGDIVSVKIVKLMTFGAFAEVMDGVDGLIHISQLANRRVNKVEEVVNVGDVVETKIVGIDTEKQKISLSIRQLLEPAPAPVVEESVEHEETAPADDALVYEVSATGEASGIAPEEDAED